MQETVRNVGRRSGHTQTREAILRAARVLFSEKGIDSTTLRAIAQSANVDPALILHFFESKENLFAETIWPIYVPLDTLPKVLNGKPETTGERLASYIIDLLDDPEMGKLAIGLVRASVHDPNSPLLRQFEHRIFRAFVNRARTDHASLRASLVCSQYLGLVLARHIHKIEPLASASRMELVAFLAPTLQQYLLGDWERKPNALSSESFE